MEDAITAVNMRTAQRGDLPAIVALLADDPLGVTRESATDAIPPEYVRAFDLLQHQLGNELLVATVGSRVVACLQLTIIAGVSRRGALRAQIEGVRVAADLRNRGIGSRLLTFALDRSRTAGAHLAQLTTDKSRADARRLYVRLGFAASHVGLKLTL